MKKIILLFIAIVIGFVIGWGAASYIARQNIQKITAEYKKNLAITADLTTPKSEFPRVVEDVNEVMKGFTKAEIKKTIEDTREWNKKTFVRDNTVALWQAILAISIEAAINVDDKEKVDKIISHTKQRFLRKYDDFYFKGDDVEKLADSIAQRIRGKQNSPITNEIGQAVNKPQQ